MPRRSRTKSLVLADIPERNHLRALQTALSARRDTVAELELELESLRTTLQTFEANYRARLANEHADLQRIERLVRHIENWGEMLRRALPERVPVVAQRIDTRRQSQLHAQAHERARAEHVATLVAATEEPAERDDRLKSAYRALARRYHPDLARDEEESVRFGQLMRRINALYRSGDLERLLSLAEQAKGGEVAGDVEDVDEQIGQLEQRLAWFDEVIENLRAERQDIERSSTCELWRNIQQARAQDRDLVEDIRAELRERAEAAVPQIRAAIGALEAEVAKFNRKAKDNDSLQARGPAGLEVAFDPYADKRIVRLGLEELQAMRPSRAATELSDWLVSLAGDHPGLLRLVLLTYVWDLSPFPLPGLETLEDLERRFATLAARDGSPMSLEMALVQADEVLEFGVKRATAQVVHTGLRFRSDAARDAVPYALRDLAVRREFRAVLNVLGEYEECPDCQQTDFAVPLYRLRGLDELHAAVCRRCGHTLRSYFLPKGKDVQSVLNPAFLDFEIISEWSFRLGRASVATQLVPAELEVMTVGDLATRLYRDVFVRNQVELDLEHLELWQDDASVAPGTSLIELPAQTFVVRLSKDARVRVAEAADLVRHRVRNRFRA